MRALTDDPSSRPVGETAALTRDYLAFERQRTTRRQYLKAFGGMAVLVMLGAVFNRVPRDEALIVAALLSLLPSWLWVAERIRWRRLVDRLDAVRARTQSESHKKSVSTSVAGQSAQPDPHIIERSVSATGHRTRLLPLTLTALGVVYGDIGTSVLYAMRECFFGSHSVPPTHDNVLGVLSLIIWSLLLVVSLKYIALVLRADNQGEGGILALTALIPNRGAAAGQSGSRLAMGRPLLVALGIFGTALLYGDGMITPAISVLGAIEGLEVVTPLFTPYVVPITVTVLIGLFAIQRLGTHRVGGLFGPVVVVWFLAIAALGVMWIVREPSVLGAFDPRHAVTFFRVNGYLGFAVLGAVFLVVTGGEALYADMGHFGRTPIRLAWFALVLPCLILNYLGQGALLLTNPDAHHTFFMMAPSWALVPVVGLATAAAFIASQALISGSFSITQQAVQLGL